MAKKTRKNWKRIAKKDRKNLKLWAEGVRETILRPHIAAYTDALERGWRAERDYVKDVCNEFHALISWRLRDEEEPELPLPEYDPCAIPETEELSDEEMEEKRVRVETLNARIGRWLKYRARRLRRPLTRDPKKDPWARLLCKLTGMNPPSKARQGYQQYMNESYDTIIEPVVRARWNAQTVGEDGTSLRTTKRIDANFRATVARELFKELPEEEQDALRSRAKDEAQRAKDEYATKLKEGPSKDPAERQKCIDQLGAFMAILLREIYEHTGLVSFAVFGGPVPNHGGELRTLTVAHGRDLRPGGTTFPLWAKARFGRDVLDFMKEWLKGVYTKQQCEESALPDADDALAGAKYRIDDHEDLGWSRVDGADSEDDEESDSETSSSSGDDDVDSEMEADVRAKKKSKKEKGKQKERRKEKKRKGDDDDDDEGTDKGKGKKRETAKTKKGEGSGGKRKAKEVIGEEGVESSKRKKTGDNSATKKRKAAEPAHDGPSKRVKGGEKAGDAEDETSNPRPKPVRKQKTVTLPNTVDGGEGGEAGSGGSNDPPPAAPLGDGNPGRGGSNDPPPVAPLGDGNPAPPQDRAAGGGERAAMNPPPPPCPEDAGEWFQGVYVEVVVEPVGDCFNNLLVAWADLERAYLWVKKPLTGRSSLSAANRPSQVALWIGAGRGLRGGPMSKGAGPTIGSVVKFEQNWWAWWASLQPPWRVRDAGHPERFSREEYGAKTSEDWDTLRAPGQNGMLSVIATLYWWGVKLKDKVDGEEKRSWVEAVCDVKWMILGLTAMETRAAAA
ncbi:hypothetical protein R3P38DRAFT_2784330 [Favolaschia claudopus]|uniref:Uncharacterized protein n=1 Tax=Favolaschia claudopus TaxID=2862362 RepID=A0AAW0AZQ3_9AGAR